jgi:uncharacterized membrane protein YdjX (TVP38/TMEM64 family)
MDRLHRFFVKHILTISLIFGGVFGLWMARAPFLNFIAWISDRRAITELILSYGVWGPVLYIFLLVLQIFVAMLPGQVLVLAGAYVFGFLPALFITVPSAIVTSQLAFYLARWAGRPLAYRLASRKVIDRWEQISVSQGVLFYFLSFVLPLFPSDAMCYVAGLGIISSSRFFVANIFGRLTSTIFTVLVGANGFDLPLVFWAAAALLIIGFYFGWLYYSNKQRLSRKNPAPPSDSISST